MADMAQQPVDLGARKAAIDATLARLTDDLLPADAAPAYEAIRYALRGAGKRFRGLLLDAAYTACGGTGDATALASAVEMLHAYSLVHDDLPCMDDDDMRRGRPTTHVAYGVPAAVVAGVTIMPLALRAVWDGARSLGLDDERVRAIAGELFGAAGASGMIGGQWRDLDAEGDPGFATETLDGIHRAKTGALIAAAARCGAVAAGAPEGTVTAIGRFAADLGLAFQIVDDVLDVTATSVTLGKFPGRDMALGKSTYAARLGVPGAMRRAQALVRGACISLDSTGTLTPELRFLADLIITRTY